MNRWQHSEREAGFSLLEVVVVLTIIALVAAVGTPLFLKGARETPHTLAVKAAHELRLARLTALNRRETTSVEIDTGRRIMTSWDAKRSISIPHYIAFQATVGRDRKTTTDKGSIRFLSDGQSTGGQIIFTQESKKKSTVSVNWLTGVVTLDVETAD